MKITRSEKMERKIFDAIKEHLGKTPRSRDKWHVSDLLYPRKAFWQRVDPQPVNDLQALYFTAGRAHHEIVEAMLGPKYNKKDRNNGKFAKLPEAERRERLDLVEQLKASRKVDGNSEPLYRSASTTDSGEFEKHGIYYSPDLRVPYPIEFKTSRMEKEPTDLKKGYEAYLKQLAKYQACMDSERGGLLVLFLGLKEGWRKRPAIRFYQVTMTAAERAAEVEGIKATAGALTAAVKKNSPRKLELCPAWMCKSDCPWVQKCKPWLVDPKRKGLKEEEEEQE